MAAFPLSRPARLAVFASGRGSNLKSILRGYPDGHPLAQVTLVVSNKADAGALTLAAEAGVAAAYIPFGRDRDGFERRAQGLLETHHTDLICLAGFMRILSPGFVRRYHGRILNIHPSLLPAFPGLDAPAQAIRAGVRESGCTVHFVDAEVDAGPIISQRRVPVEPGDTPERLAARILAEEHDAYPEAIAKVLTGEVAMTLPVAGRAR